METDTKKENLQVLSNLLNEAREEADRLRRKVKKYENILMSTRLIMGHELKKPTTAIAGYLDLAADVLEDPSSGEGEAKKDALESLSKARNECELLNELNQVFLALLKMNGDMELLPVRKINLSGLFDEVIDGFPERHDAQSRVQIRISPEITDIHFNPNALKLIMTNLIENALLYSAREAQVVVEVERVIDKRRMSNRELMKITIVDRGVGIPDEYLQKIFYPFVRLHQDGADGMGLGLTLVRSLIELHGGDISISSKKGSGTTVYLTVPVLEDNQEQMIT